MVQTPPTMMSFVSPDPPWEVWGEGPWRGRVDTEGGRPQQDHQNNGHREDVCLSTASLPICPPASLPHLPGLARLLAPCCPAVRHAGRGRPSGHSRQHSLLVATLWLGEAWLGLQLGLPAPIG